MTKEELVAELAQRSDVTKAAAEAILNSLTDLIVERAQAGEATKIHNFGSFDMLSKKATTARNPRTGETVSVPAMKVLRFRASKTTRQTA